MSVVALTEVLKQMDSGNEFSIVFFTCDRKRKTGGQRIELERATKNEQKARTDFEGEGRNYNHTLSAKNPHHFENATRNIVIPSSGRMRKVHIRLITKFNGQRVIW